MSDWNDLKLPFGQTADGRMVSPAEVERGAACGCVCPQCATPLVARKGDVLRHHFAHSSEGCGSGALETSLHKMAKQIIADAGRVWVPEMVIYQSNRTHHIEIFRKVSRDGWIEGAVSLEQRLADFQPDAVLRSPTLDLGIEVYVTHAVDPAKRLKIQEAQLATLEIDLSRYDRKMERGQLAQFVLKDAPRFWLFHPRLAVEIEIAQAELARLVGEKEAQAAIEAEETRVRIENARRMRAELDAHEALRRSEEERRALVDAVAAQRMAAAPVHAFEIPLSGYFKAAMMRPARWDGLTNFPTKGAHCADCGHGVWRRTVTGWGCSSCVPAETRGRIAA